MGPLCFHVEKLFKLFQLRELLNCEAVPLLVRSVATFTLEVERTLKSLFNTCRLDGNNGDCAVLCCQSNLWRFQTLG